MTPGADPVVGNAAASQVGHAGQLKPIIRPYQYDQCTQGAAKPVLCLQIPSAAMPVAHALNFSGAGSNIQCPGAEPRYGSRPARIGGTGVDRQSQGCSRCWKWYPFSASRLKGGGRYIGGRQLRRAGSGWPGERLSAVGEVALPRRLSSSGSGGLALQFAQ